MKKGLLGDLIPTRSTKESDLEKLSKITNKKATTVKLGKNNSIIDKINTINAEVYKHLGKYKDNIKVISNLDDLTKYVDLCVTNGIVAIDTETTSLDPITCELVGVCLYTPTSFSVYIPVNHQSYITTNRLEEQVNIDDLANQLNRLKNVKQIYHNAKYDMRVLHWYLGVDLEPYWDTMIGAKLLNENESAQLKYQYAKYIEKTEKEYDFDSLFNGVDFRQVPIETASLYAATDAYITFKLYEFQKQFIGNENYKGITNVFFNVEMPVISVIADMENNGIEIDTNFAKELSVKYHKQLEEAYNHFMSICDGFGEKLDAYRAKMGVKNKLEYPINISSPTQIAIMLYDVLGLTSPDKNSPRGTGEEILIKLNHPISDAILEYRGIQKLLTTYIDKLPQVINSKTGRIHASFNQYGAATGRFSSSDPNLQNIPSKNSEIRQMFKAKEGYVLVGSDYSQQEPRILAQFCQDQHLINAYKEGKDLYAWSASLVFHKPYEECREFYADGTLNKEGKKLRAKMKAIILGIMYSKGVKAIAEDLQITAKEAQNLFDTFFKQFPNVKSFMEQTQELARKNGYVETIWGRKRRLPDMQRPLYEFQVVSSKPRNFNPLFDDDFEMDSNADEQIEHYKKLIYNCYGFREKMNIKQKALAEGIKIIDNGGFIAEATRQCVNSRIQGSAADMTKIAMSNIYRNQELRDLGFKLLITVHDEVIGECPIENAKRVAQLLTSIMIESAKPEVAVPMKCDAEITKNWYGPEINLDEEKK